MKLKQLIKIVLLNIYYNKLRSFLTTLGVIVGTATIFAVIAIGQGAEAQVNNQFSQLNPGQIMIMPASRGKVISQLTKNDAEDMSKYESISVALATLSGNFDVTYANFSTSVTVQGVSPAFQNANNLKLSKGFFFTDDDEKARRAYVILGADLATDLFLDNVSLAVGNTISIKNRKFEVIGVLERMGSSGPGMDYDNSAFMPYTVGERYLFGTRANPRLTVIAKDINSIQETIADITAVLDINHKIGGGSEQFRVIDAGSRLLAAQQTARTMALLLLSIATVVLVVSGIGIMNVMFVTVKERTREIGTLKAIGAKKKEILLQFLLEAVIISLSGGLIGIVFGFVLLPLLRSFEIPAIPSFSAVIIGLLFSIITGVFFGYYPALKAADLNPIEALRYE